MTSSASTQSCPWCGKPVSDAVALCPNCHRSPAQHPSLRAPKKAGADVGLDLELGSIPPPPGARTPASEDPPSEPLVAAVLPDAAGHELETVQQSDAPAIGGAEPTGMADSFGFGGLDDDDVEPLEVELSEGRAVPPSAAAPPPGAPASAPGGAPASAPTSAAGPTALQPLAAPPVPDATEIARVAEYGEAPPNIVGAVPYAVRVLRRRPQLRKILAEREVLHAETTFECRSRYSDMLQQLRADHPEDSRIDELSASLQQSDALVQERAAQLADAQQETAARVGAIDQELRSLEADRQGLAADREQSQTSFDSCAEQRERAQAALKRADIQLRALHEAARQAAGKGAKFAPPEHARQIAQAEEQRAGLNRTLQKHQQAFDEAREALRVHDAALREMDRRIAAVRTKRRGVEQQGSQRQSVQAEGVKAAEAERLQRCEQAVKQLMAERHTALDAELRREIHDIDARLRRSELDLETHRQAVSAFDRSSVRNGLLILAIGVVILLVVLGTAINVGGGAESPPAAESLEEGT